MDFGKYADAGWAGIALALLTALLTIVGLVVKYLLSELSKNREALMKSMDGNARLMETNWNLAGALNFLKQSYDTLSNQSYRQTSVMEVQQKELTEIKEEIKELPR